MPNHTTLGRNEDYRWRWREAERGGREKRRGRSIGGHGKVREEERMKKNSKGSVREE